MLFPLKRFFFVRALSSKPQQSTCVAAARARSDGASAAKADAGAEATQLLAPWQRGRTTGSYSCVAPQLPPSAEGLGVRGHSHETS